MECSGRTKSHDASLWNTLVIWLGVEQDELHSQSACKQNSCLASVTQKARKVIVKKGLTTTKKAFLVNLKLVLSNIPNYYKARMGNDVIRHCAKLWIHLYPFICREKKNIKNSGFQVSTAYASESSPQGLFELIILYFSHGIYNNSTFLPDAIG